MMSHESAPLTEIANKTYDTKLQHSTDLSGVCTFGTFRPQSALRHPHEHLRCSQAVQKP